MDAWPILMTLARVLEEHRLEAVLIGNAAAALQGAPVTTLDFDFLFRKTPGNLRKLRAVAKRLGAVVFKPLLSGIRSAASGAQRGLAAAKLHGQDSRREVVGEPAEPRCPHRFWRA